MKKILLVGFWFGQTIVAFAGLQGNCNKLSACAEVVSKLTGVQYLLTTKDISLTVQSTSNLQLKKENADQIFTEILAQNGFTRIRFSANSYLIVGSRDVRYETIPEVTASFSQAPQLPETTDYLRMTYQFENAPLKAQMSEMAIQSLRPLLSRYGRIIELRATNQVMIADTARHLAVFYPMLKRMDQTFSAEQLAIMTAKKCECPAP